MHMSRPDQKKIRFLRKKKIEKVNAPPEKRPSAFSFTNRRGCIEFDKKDELRLVCPKRILRIIALLVL